MNIEQKKPGKIRAAILNWLGVPVGLTDGAFWSEYYGGDSSSGASVSDKSVLKLSAAWSCTRLISETIATLPLSIYERTATGKRVARDHPLHFILHDQPNADTTTSVQMEALVASMLLRGNGRCEKLMRDGRLVGLKFLNPDRLALVVTSSGRKEWHYREDSRTEPRVIPADRIWNVPGFSLDGVSGVSVISYGSEVFGSAISADRAANGAFKRGLMPTVALSYPQQMRPEQRDEGRRALESLSGSVNSGRPIILEGGTEVHSIGIKPTDAQLLESRTFSVEEVCRWFRVPPHMVGHSEKSTSWGTGIEQQMIGFLTFTIGPWLKRIEQAISKDLLSPADRLRYYPKFSVEGLLRADSAARASFYSSMVNNGIMTRDEVRELEDKPPMGGNAAVLTVQTAMAPLDSVGAVSGDNLARASMRSFLGVTDAAQQD